MSNKFNKLFEEYVWRPYDYSDICWIEDEEYLSYNTENNVANLMEGYGATYSGYIKNQVEIDGYVLLTVDSEQGWEYQAVFSVNRKVAPSEYWVKAEEEKLLTSAQKNIKKSLATESLK